jgi:hypothetical protein
MFSFLRSAAKTRPAATTRPPTVWVEPVGREHAGKTVLLDELDRAAFDQPLRSGQRLGVADPRRLAEALRRRRDAERRLRREGRETTVHPEVRSYTLLEAGRERAALRVRDEVGQVLTRTTPGAPPELQGQYAEYLGRLAEVDVLWQVIPCPPAQHTAADIERFRDDVQLTTAYVRTALSRRPGRPCVLGVVLSRIDQRYHSEQHARQRLPGELSGWLTRQLRDLVGCPEVGEAAVLPVSALGFGTAVACPRAAASAGNGGLACGEREWLLRPGAVPRPFNLLPLAAWSLLAGLRVREADGLGAGLPEAIRLCRVLREDLEALGGWQIPLKGP